MITQRRRVRRGSQRRKDISPWSAQRARRRSEWNRLECVRRERGTELRTAVIATLLFLCGAPCWAQKRAAIPAAQVAEEVRNYRLNNEDRIMRELTEFLAIPNVASDTENIQKNAAHLVEMLEARGIETHLLPISGRGPVVFGKLNAPDAKRTVIFYAHYDGQPVDPAAWTDGKPFEPVLRSDSIEAGGKRIPLPEKRPGAYNDNWRIYARSASDDKGAIVALLAALDALRAQRIPLGVNLKVIFEGEEEAGSTNLERTLQLHKNLLGGDLLAMADGPVHQSGRPLVFFGNRGDIGLDITVYGPVRALHSGHYGNWAPNPAMELSRLLASMRDANGRVLIDGYYDDIVPLSAIEKEALSKMPDNDAELERELGIAQRVRGRWRAKRGTRESGSVHRRAAGERRGSAQEIRADCRVYPQAGILRNRPRADHGRASRTRTHRQDRARGRISRFAYGDGLAGFQSASASSAR